MCCRINVLKNNHLFFFYYYANFSTNLIKRNLALHNPDYPLLIGNIRENDAVKEFGEPNNIETREKVVQVHILFRQYCRNIYILMSYIILYRFFMRFLFEVRIFIEKVVNFIFLWAPDLQHAGFCGMHRSICGSGCH